MIFEPELPIYATFLTVIYIPIYATFLTVIELSNDPRRQLKLVHIYIYICVCVCV